MKNKEGYKIFIDDIRNPENCISYMYSRIGALNPIYLEEWKIVRNYNEFVKHIKENGLPTHISFDHDLADEHYDASMYDGLERYNEHLNTCVEKTGADCAKWLVEYLNEYSLKLPICIVHSCNPIGSENIKNILNNKSS